MILGNKTSKPLTQTVLPVLTSMGQLKGLVLIARTVFDGDIPPLFNLPSGPVPTYVVNLNTDGSLNPRVEEFVGIVVGQEIEYARPWMSYTGFVDAQDGGYYSHMVCVTAGFVESFNYGVVLGPMANGLDTNIIYETSNGTVPELPPVDGEENNQPTGWLTSVNIETANKQMFFDYDWRYLFSLLFKDKIATSIQVIRQPASTVKASVVSDQQGTISTLRLLRLGPMQKQDYVVGVQIQADRIYDLNLTLRVI